MLLQSTAIQIGRGQLRCRRRSSIFYRVHFRSRGWELVGADQVESRCVIHIDQRLIGVGEVRSSVAPVLFIPEEVETMVDHGIASSCDHVSVGKELERGQIFLYRVPVDAMANVMSSRFTLGTAMDEGWTNADEVSHRVAAERVDASECLFLTSATGNQFAKQC
jgi:hypothetical protein